MHEVVIHTSEKESPCSPVDEKGKESSQSADRSSEEAYGDDDAVYVKGEPVITTGSDVSNFLVDVRDDGDPALTFRSLFIGTIFACLGATLCQVRLFASCDVIC